MSGKSLKVTDRRMFTADGELREEYRDLEQTSAPSNVESRPSAPPPAVSPQAAAPVGPMADQPMAAQPADRLPDEPGPPDAADAPGFMDLVGLLAEPAMIYLRQAHGADPQTAVESLELARLHIDLLGILRTKTQGNLSASEQAMLEDVLNQLRSGYVGLRS